MGCRGIVVSLSQELAFQSPLIGSVPGTTKAICTLSPVGSVATPPTVKSTATLMYSVERLEMLAISGLLSRPMEVEPQGQDDPDHTDHKAHERPCIQQEKDDGSFHLMPRLP